MSTPPGPPPQSYPDQPFYPPAPPLPVKRANPWKWLVLGCGGLLTLGVCVVVAVSVGLVSSLTGSSGKTTTGSTGGTGVPVAVAGQGQTVSIKNWDVTLVGVDRPGKDLTWSQFGNKSTAAGTWLVAVVKMKNTGSTNFGVNNPDFEIRAAGGIKYSVSSDGGSYGYSTFKGGQQIGGQVPPGVEVTYYIPFDVAPNATGMQLVFKQDKNPAFTVGNAAP